MELVFIRIKTAVMFKLAGCVGVARRRHCYPRNNIHSLMELKDSLTEFKASLMEFKASLMELKDSLMELKDSFTSIKGALRFRATLRLRSLYNCNIYDGRS